MCAHYVCAMRSSYVRLLLVAVSYHRETYFGLFVETCGWIIQCLISREISIKSPITLRSIFFVFPDVSIRVSLIIRNFFNALQDAWKKKSMENLLDKLIFRKIFTLFRVTSSFHNWIITDSNWLNNSINVAARNISVNNSKRFFIIIHVI